MPGWQSLLILVNSRLSSETADPNESQGLPHCSDPGALRFGHMGIRLFLLASSRSKS